MSAQLPPPVSFSFHLVSEDVLPFSQKVLSQWLTSLILEKGRSIEKVDFILTNDDFVLDLNAKYLNHHDYTDILTFPYTYDPIFSEIFISTDRVSENALNMGVSYENELIRVLCHGVLHMLGYDDHTQEDAKEMRLQEGLAMEKFFTNYDPCN